MLPFIPLNQCTAVRPMSLYYDISANTNPAQEYGRVRVVSRGGGIYHRAFVSGPIGNATAFKTGRACAYSGLWLLAYGNAGINEARKNGGIQRIASVEYDILAVGGVLYHRFCTVVQGE
ncbi:MAG: TRL-like family protein [Leptospiraceae bacterium]|nr:TRL-like family protein [Leptospiraceae bacterium]